MPPSCQALAAIGCHHACLGGIPPALRASLVAELVAEHRRFPYRLDAVMPAHGDRRAGDGRYDDGTFCMAAIEEEGRHVLIYSAESFMDLAASPCGGVEPVGSRHARGVGYALLGGLRSVLGTSGCGRVRALMALPGLVRGYLATGAYSVAEAPVIGETVRRIARHEVGHLRDMQGQFDGTEMRDVPPVSLYSLKNDMELYAEAYTAGRLRLACDTGR